MIGSKTRWFLIGGAVVTALLFAGLRPLYRARLGEGADGSLAYGLIACFTVIVGSFFLSKRAIAASMQMFLLVFLGGVLGRLVLFGGLIGAAFAAPELDGTAAAIAILAAFFPLTFLELYCVVGGADEARNDRTTDSGG